MASAKDSDGAKAKVVKLQAVLTVSFDVVEVEATSTEDAAAKARALASNLFLSFVTTAPNGLAHSDHYVRIHDVETGELLAEHNEPGED